MHTSTLVCIKNKPLAVQYRWDGIQEGECSRTKNRRIKKFFLGLLFGSRFRMRTFVRSPV